MEHVKNKVEDKLGVDLNHDGRIGGPGPLSKAEESLHIDFNHDGIIGGHRENPTGGLLGRIERLTRVDMNKDGKIATGADPRANKHKH